MPEILIDPHVDTIFMPENVRVGLMIAEKRKRCQKANCPFDYAGFAFGQSPFHHRRYQGYDTSRGILFSGGF